jgi:hypothetical protein
MSTISVAGLTLELASDGPFSRRLAAALRDAVRDGSL